MSKPAKIDPADLSVGWQGSASGSGSFDRSTQRRSLRLTITHRPSGISMESEHGPDYLTKTAWKAKKRQMYDALLADLEKALAGRARKPGPKP